MSYNPQNVNGQATMANSAPVVIASNQSTVPVANRVAQLTVTTGSITASGQNVTATTDVPNAGTATVFIYGTFSGANLTFEISPDGVVWAPVNGQQSATGGLTTSGATGALSGASATAGIAYDIPLPGPAQFRVRATALTSGTVSISICPAVNAFEVAPTVVVATALPTGGNTIGNVGISGTPAFTMTPTGNVLTSFVNSAATTNATLVKSSAGSLYAITASNTGASAAYVKLYNLAAAPTVGTSTPVITITIPASGSVNFDFGAIGARFTTGISLAITNLAADTDTTAVAASQVKVITAYI